MKRFAAVPVAFGLACKAALAACPQELALYGEASANAEISFVTEASGMDAVTGQFTMRFPENGVTFDGVIMATTEPFRRPWGIVMHNCPEGDVTGTELAECTVWEGVVYGLDDVGNVFYLPPLNEGGEAAKTILLPDFAASVRLSSAWGARGLSTAPKDDFKLTGCQE